MNVSFCSVSSSIFCMIAAGKPPEKMEFQPGCHYKLSFVIFRMHSQILLEGKSIPEMRKCNLSLSFSFSLTKIMDTHLTAVPAKTVSEVSSGGAQLIHQQQTGKQSLQLQWNHSDLRRKVEKNLLHITMTHKHYICGCTYFGPWFVFVFQVS